VLPLVGSWEASFAFWSIPVFITAMLVAIATSQAGKLDGVVPPRLQGMPDWRSSRMWRLGMLQSSASMIYFGANTFIPDYLHSTNQPELVGAALASLNGAQVPASAVIGFVPWRVLARRETSYGVALAILLGLLVVVTLPGPPLVVAAGVFGFFAAYILVLSFALPALLAGPGDVARLSAGTFAISYTTAFFVTLVSGAVWDATHVEASAFLPALVGSLVVAVFAPGLVKDAVSS
jgi:CP family cyanate transporter-like MFS transporter